MVSISKPCLKAIIQHMNQNYPNEGCGVISSSINSPDLLTYFHPIINRHPSPRHHFLYDAQQWINVNYKINTTKQFISCYVHSHIQAPAILSDEDLAHIYDTDALQMIVHYAEKNSPSLHLYRFNELTKIYENCSLMST